MADMKENLKRVAQMSRITSRIVMVWLRNPNLRLCQLIGNCFNAGDNYAKTDDELERMLKKMYPLTKSEEKEIEGCVKRVMEE